MLNYLIMGWHAQIYKHNPTVRVWIDEQFVDEFELENTASHEDLKRFDLNLSRDEKDYLQPSSHEFKQIEILQKIPCQSKILLIQIPDGKSELKIKIEIKDSYSNFTNGFMTKQTLVHLHHLFVLNEKLVKDIEKIEKRYRYLVDTSRPTHIKCFFYSHKSKNRRKQIYQNFSIDSEKSFKNTESVLLPNVWVGGDGYYKINLKKRFGFWTKHDNVHGVWKLGERKLVQYIRNKYLHEDQRNNR